MYSNNIKTMMKHAASLKIEYAVQKPVSSDYLKGAMIRSGIIKK